MSTSPAMPRPVAAGAARQRGATRYLAALGWCGVIVLVYFNCLDAPFQFDDQPAVRYNETIRHLGRLAEVLQPPADGAGVTGRPVVNLSLAINYALGGLDVWGYHGMNLWFHLLATLTLWGVLGRTLRQPVIPVFFRNCSGSLAGCVTLLWAVHPLLTESVVCIAQRNEIIGSLFYLLTLYGFIRSTEERETAGLDPEGASVRLWQGVAIASCMLGMASKEIVATAPLMVLLYDRTFVAGSFATAWRQRRRFYLGLAATWLLLAALMLANHQRAGAAGFGLGVSSWDYLLTQCRALVIYLRLALWPHPLVVDYGAGVVTEAREVWAQGLLVVVLLLGTGGALWRKPVLGFVGAWFFVILAPSSSFVPLTTQTIAEHRMYLPLVAVLMGAVMVLRRLAGRATVAIAILLAVGLGWQTRQRNEIYGSELSLWTDTVEHAPGNPRAHLNLGQALFQSGRLPEAEQQFQAALQLRPAYPEALYNLGLTEAQLGRPADAIGHFESALQLVPDYAVALNDLGIALAEQRRTDEALVRFAEALRYRPDFAGAHFNLGNLLVRLGRPAEAIPHYESALQRNPGLAEYHANLALALMQIHRPEDAVRHFESATKLAPLSPDLHLNLALALAATGRLREALPQVETALRLRPDFVVARHYLSEMQADLKKMEENRP